MSTHKTLGIVWFRQDLRLSDNPAFSAACKECEYLLPLFIDDSAAQTVSRVGSASRVWLHHALVALQRSLRQRDLDLVLRQGAAAQELQLLINQFAQSHSIRLYWNRCYDPATLARDKKIKRELKDQIDVFSFNGLLLFEPWETLKKDGTPYRVFTPFYRNLTPRLVDIQSLTLPRQRPLQVRLDPTWSHSVDTLALLPDSSTQGNWDEKMMSHWRVGEAAAKNRLQTFLRSCVDEYPQQRNLPALDATSRLSPHLHFGEISPRQIMVKLVQQFDDVFTHGSGAETLAREILWREFAYQLIFHFPQMVDKPLDTRFARFPWAKSTSRLRRAWQQGRTGVPIVDAGMRQLWQCGWMHNRVRMIVGSYWVKNLLQDWRKGENWFRDTLVDADMASNVMGWQWVAGCGADAAPYFRVFNPVLQGEKFDPDAHYVRRWVPELRDIPNKYAHKPWELPQAQRPADYPEPLVDLKQSRQRALMSFDKIKEAI